MRVFSVLFQTFIYLIRTSAIFRRVCPVVVGPPCLSLLLLNPGGRGRPS